MIPINSKEYRVYFGFAGSSLSKYIYDVLTAGNNS